MSISESSRLLYSMLILRCTIPLILEAFEYFDLVYYVFAPLVPPIHIKISSQQGISVCE